MYKVVLCKKQKNLPVFSSHSDFSGFRNAHLMQQNTKKCLSACPVEVSTWHEHRRFFCKLLGSLNDYGSNPKGGKLPGP